MKLSPLIVVSAGTYHLPFDRLIDWVESWLRSYDNPVTVVVQHGVSRPLIGAQNHVMIAPRDLLDLYRRADVVILQGGAGGVMDARQAARLPVLVPRVPVSGEVVDDHQIRFARRLGELGYAFAAESEQQLHRLVNCALSGEISTRMSGTHPTPGSDNVIRILNMSELRLTKTERRQRLRRSTSALLRNLRKSTE